MFCASSVASLAADDALRLAGRTELPGYTGDFDHFEYDLPSGRLWLAAEDHGTLDLFDLKTGALRKTFRGLVDTPHGIFYVPQKKRLIVTDSGGKAMATRMMYGLSTSAGTSGFPPKVTIRCGSERKAWAPNFESSDVHPSAPS